ncbi:hypothetical protein ShirakiTA10_24630 [Bacillus safensis]|nr:hypothetical protein ShirakiTA10_24630 [Bacillus safensis]
MRSEFDIREYRSADLTPKARVCLHAETDSMRIGLFVAYQMGLSHKMYKLFVCKG